MSIVTLKSGSFLNVGRVPRCDSMGSDTAVSVQSGAAVPATGPEGSPAVTLRPMSRADFPALATWLRAPHVEAWFPWLHGETAAS